MNLTIEQSNTLDAEIFTLTSNLYRRQSGSLGKRAVMMTAGIGVVAGAFAFDGNESQTAEAFSPLATFAEAHQMNLIGDTDDDGSFAYSVRVETGDKENTADSSTTSTTNKPTTTTEAPTTTVEAKSEFMPAGVIGERPCGPEVDKVEVKRRFEAGEIIVKPNETADFLKNNPQILNGLNERYTKESNNDTRWITAVSAVQGVLNPEILDGIEDELSPALKARAQAFVLKEDLHVRNTACNPVTGEIYNNPGANGGNNNLQEGDQVWAISLNKTQYEMLKQRAKKEGFSLPATLLTFENEEGGLDILLERLACNNPIFEIPEEIPVASTTTSTTIEVTTSTDGTTTTTETTTTTIGETTTTTVLETTTTAAEETTTSVEDSVPDTDAPTTTQKGEETTTTGCDDYQPCGETTTTVETTTTTTGSTTTTTIVTTTTVGDTTTTTVEESTTTEDKGEETTVPPEDCDDFTPCDEEI